MCLGGCTHSYHLECNHKGTRNKSGYLIVVVFHVVVVVQLLLSTQRLRLHHYRALIVVDLVVGITLLVKGVTTLCGGDVQTFDSCVQSRLLEEIFGGILLVVSLLCAALMWCPCMHRVSIGVAERSSRVVTASSRQWKRLE